MREHIDSGGREIAGILLVIFRERYCYSAMTSVDRLREVSHAVAVAVVATAFEQGLARAIKPPDLDLAVRERMWEPVYRRYVPAP